MAARPGFFGEIVRRRAIGSFTLTEARFAPHLQVPHHHHSDSYLTLVLEGAYRQKCSLRTRTCAPATVILHAPEEAHTDHFGETGGRCFTVEFAPSWLRRIRALARAFDHEVQCDGGPAARIAEKLYLELYAADELSVIAVEGLTLELLAALSRTTTSVPRRPRWLEEVHALLQLRFAEPISLADAAEAIGVHPVHLARTFRQRYGCTVGEYLRQLRIELACRQLVETSQSLTEIALACGFSHQSHFTSAFRRTVGLPPGVYRKRALKSRNPLQP